MTKRLFLFAGYDRDGIVDETLTYYLNELSKLGDIVFVMDNDTNDAELKKIKQIPNVLYAQAQRHNEYDFGSYKRAYIWARDNNILKNYDWIYLVNDSVYGPLNSLEPLLNKLEKNGANITGMTEYQDKNTPTHIQSWFVGLDKDIFSSHVFDSFMLSIQKESNKADIICKYEVGMSRRLLRYGFKMFALMYNQDDFEHFMYDAPIKALNQGIPFIKKRAISKLEGMYNLYPHTDNACLVDAIIDNMKRNNIKIPLSDDKNKNYKYRKYFRLTCLGLPIITVYRKKRFVEYKICLLDCIPVLKINLHKKDS
ncbi:MAG: hypothetical protein IJY99_00020 [Alphaproteobacteria bacterium]|nr:hypothetical protein [Alphaproteobacteria bacterium]